MRLRRSDPHTLSLIPEHAQIIAFRNVLIHGYDAIDHPIAGCRIRAD